MLWLESGIAWAHYWNHEAVLLDEGVSPPARGRTVYRKNPHALTRVQRSAIPSVLPGKPYFTSHEGGKTAARVMPDTLPRGVHSFQFENPMLGESAFTVPAILHLPYKSAAHFCDKHLTQGIFSTEQLFGMQWTPPGVYAEAQHLCRGQDIEGLRALYSRAVTLTQAERDRLETHGYLLTTQAPLPFDADWAG